jgi:hypothetical protein
MMKHSKLTLMQSTNYQEAERSLRYWGKYLQKQIYERHRVGCILPKLIMYGQNIPTGYYDYPETMNEGILQTHRVFVYMPPVMQQVTMLQYVFGGHKVFKAKRIGIKTDEFNRLLSDAKEFYEQHKNINFS